MRYSIDFWIIMSLTALIVVCGIMVSCHPADAARGCLTRDRAERAWPTKEIGIDDDGCFTFMRKGIKPAPGRPMVGADDIAAANAEIDMPRDGKVPVEAGVALDMMQRWPTVVEMKLERYEPFVETEPVVSVKTMWMALLAMVGFAAVLETMFGGWLWKPKNDRAR